MLESVNVSEKPAEFLAWDKRAGRPAGGREPKIPADRMSHTTGIFHLTRELDSRPFYGGKYMHKPLFLITAGSVAAVGALVVASALPAGAATSVRAETTAFTPCTPPTGGGCADTPVTFTLTTTGVLAITAPTATVDLGSGVSHNVGSVIGLPRNFGAVAVTDNRALDPADWTATVSSTDFTNSVTPADVIPATAATYTAGTIGSDLVSGLPYSAADITDNTPVTLSGTAQDVVTEAGADGDNAATWTPTIAVAVPAGAVVGIYDGTVTHSVS